MEYQSAAFLAAYGTREQLPVCTGPEVVFSGRSNVGKSSAINRIFHRKSLARTSSIPGKTTTINFFTCQDAFFVDLPGYGYSKMSKKEQVIVGNFIEEYLHKRKQIALIIFLVDIRHKPTENDKLMYNYIISSKIPFIIIANKADKIAVTKVDAATQEIQKALNPIGDITTLPFSSERRIYTENVWNEIEKYI